MLSDDVEMSGGWALNALTDLAVGGAEQANSTALLGRLATPRELRVNGATLSRRRTLIGTGYKTLAEVASEGAVLLSASDPQRLELHAVRFRSVFTGDKVRSGDLILTSITAELTAPAVGRARISGDGSALTAKFTTGLSLRATARSAFERGEAPDPTAELVLWPEQVPDVSAVLIVRALESGVLEARLRFAKQGLLLRAVGRREPRAIQLCVEANDAV